MSGQLDVLFKTIEHYTRPWKQISDDLDLQLQTYISGEHLLCVGLYLFLTLKVPEKLQLYGLYVCYVVHICDFGMLRVKQFYIMYIEIINQIDTKQNLFYVSHASRVFVYKKLNCVLMSTLD